ncbi:MAG: nucleotidyltransferase domain-containing protein [Sulfurimonas sp.]|nr:nucleotidyltransferase domain-containing protein [Sulfurimonas sp.]
MRLTKYEIQSIKQTFLDVFGSGYIYLFGSRVDDNVRGGDIDLYIQTKNSELVNKIKFLARLKEKIGDQKIDVVISKDKNRVIEKEALKKGILL